MTVTLKVDAAKPYRMMIDCPDGLVDEITKRLTFKDKSADYEYRKFKSSIWIQKRLGDEEFSRQLAAKKLTVHKCLLFRDDDTDGYFTYAGLADHLARDLAHHDVEVIGLEESRYPEASSLPWKTTPPDLRDYQEDTVATMMQHRHCRAELATGAGKAFILMHIVRRLGLKTVVMAPSVSIARQLYGDFKEYLGDRYVGFYGDGKKQFNKLITIGIAASLTKIEPDSEAWDKLSTAQVFCSDESHLLPATTLDRVATGMCGSAPWRFAFSATQLRGDGAGLLLDGLTGPTVKSMALRELVDSGWLARPSFRMVEVPGHGGFYHRDPNEMTRHHLYYNDHVVREAAKIANMSVQHAGHQVLILVQEIEQFSHLLPYLKYPVAFAHGGGLDDNIKKKIPAKYHDSDTGAIVKSFDNREIPILVGTSCISTGTDIKSVETMIYLMGQSSEIKVKQAVGRCTRLAPGKKTCNVYDFDVKLAQDRGTPDQWSTTHRHASIRRGYYEDLYGPVETIS